MEQMMILFQQCLCICSLSFLGIGFFLQSYLEKLAFTDPYRYDCYINMELTPPQFVFLMSAGSSCIALVVPIMRYVRTLSPKRRNHEGAQFVPISPERKREKSD